MKNYFEFTLKGEKLFPIWMGFYVVVLVPYFILLNQFSNIEFLKDNFLLIFGAFILIILLALSITFYIVKMTTEGIVYKGNSLKFEGSIGKYIGIILLGFFLSTITFGIYFPWFVRNINAFFLGNSKYKDENFRFKGEAAKLFVYVLLAFIIPMFILSYLMVSYGIIDKSNSPYISAITQQLVNVILMGPYLYLVYKWTVNIDFKNYNIRWETDFWQSVGEIIYLGLLTLITLGFYYPMMLVKLYSYFTNRTVAYSPEEKRRFGFDEDNKNDYIFILLQCLLLIITAGIYFPWAFCKIQSRILSRTYLEEGVLNLQESTENNSLLKNIK